MQKRPPNVKAIFDEALEVETPAEREAYLDRACAHAPEVRRRVEALLRAHEEAGSFLEPPHPAPAPSGEDPGGAFEGPGALIGPYKLLEKIGEGGFGVVYLALQERPVERRAALKIIKPGMDSRQVIARFEAERQALALMDHPNVARVLDAGTTERGRPYFVMELIKGIPITEYCDQCDLTPRERLALFLQVCQGVQHAHQKGIIHRDLKPSNVLVAMRDGRPVAKVIDFGVAKAINRRLTAETLSTGFSQLLGTPLYMSPEQAEMSPLELDTRTDIYSLGVLLYELLTGTTPFEKGQLGEASFDEIRRVIRDVDPPPPSTRVKTLGRRADAVAGRRRMDPRKLALLLRGDLDWIAVKALEKDRARRYETASALAADIERYLGDEPVEACPPSRMYRLRKFARRNRSSLLLSASLLLAFVVLAGSIGWMARDRAVRRTALEGEVTRALEEAAAWYRGDRMTEAMSSARRAESLLPGGVGDELRERVLRWRNDLETAASLEKIRLEQVRERSGEFKWGEADSAYRELFRSHGLDVEALDPAGAAERIRASAIRDRLLTGLDAWLLAKSKAELPGGDVLLAVARLADPDPRRNLFREAFERRDRQALVDLAREGDALIRSPATVQLLTHILFEMDERPLAVEILRRAQEQHPHDFWLNLLLGYLLEDTSPAQSAGFYRAAMALRPEGIATHVGLGNALFNQGETEAAIAVFRKGLALHPGEGKLATNLGVALHRKGELDEALAELEKAVQLQPDEAMAHYGLAGVLRAKGDVDGAIAALERAVDLDPKLSRAHLQLGIALTLKEEWEEAMAAFRAAIAAEPDHARSHRGLALCLSETGRLAEATDIYRKAIDLEPGEAEGHYNLGVNLQRLGDLDEAIAAYRKAGELAPDDFRIRVNLGKALMEQGNAAGARAEFQKAVELSPESFEARNNLGVILVDLGKLDEAIVELRRATELRPDAASTRGSLGVALVRTGDLGEGVTQLRKAAELDPDDAQVRTNLAVALKMEGKLDEAISALRKAVELDPERAGARANLALALLEGGQVDEAILELGKAIELDPRAADYHNSLGIALRRKGRVEEAILEYRKAIELDPAHANAHYNLGNAALNQGKPDEAIAFYRKAIEAEPSHAEAHMNLGDALLKKSDFEAAVACLERAHELGSRSPRWPHPTAKMVEDSRKLLDLDRRLPRVLAGEEAPAGGGERTAFAEVCYHKRRHEQAARFFEEAFAAEPALAEDPASGHRYNAACNAALAAAGEGVDAGSLAEEARAGRRRQALDWLRADLDAHRRSIEGDAASREAAVHALRHWRHDPDLAAVREPERLAGLPAAEREAWRKLWRDVEDVLLRLGKDGA